MAGRLIAGNSRVRIGRCRRGDFPIVQRLRVSALAWVVLWCSVPAHAQLRVVALQAGDSAEQEVPPGFQIPVNADVSTALGDFERFAKRKDWERAFQALDGITDTQRGEMVVATGGVILRARELIWQAIAGLPAEGREAFRVFYDARARQAFAEIARKPAEDVVIARQVFDRYFLTSVGDNAANLLGDAAFERGQFAEAERYWKGILDHHPDHDLGDARLQVKRAIALLWLGQQAAFETLAKDIGQRYRGERVLVGGVEQDAASLLDRLKSQATSSGRADPADSDSPEPRPGGPWSRTVEPLWQVKYVGSTAHKLLTQTSEVDYYYSTGVQTYVPPFVVHEQRLYGNWFGVVFAVDLQTGKLLWRSEPFSKLHPQLPNLSHSSMSLEQYAVAAGPGIVVATSVDPQRLNYHEEPFRLIAYDAQSGSIRWDSKKVAGLEQLGFVGEPVVEADGILAVSHTRGSMKLVLSSLSLTDGTQTWSRELGTAQRLARTRGQPHLPLPIAHVEPDQLFLVTNNGGLLAIDRLSRELQFAVRYDGPATGSSESMIYYGDEPLDELIALHSQGKVLEREGLLYVKEAGGRKLYAVDPRTPGIAWSRPVEREAVLVGVDDEHLYLLTRELLAIDRKTQALVWARRLPVAGGGLSAVLGPRHLFVFTSRGIFCLSKQDGRVAGIHRGADLGSIGGRILLAGDLMLCVSSENVTAYPLPDESPRDAGGS
jgi:outer membrane protein assembly factor BamB